MKKIFVLLLLVAVVMGTQAQKKTKPDHLGMVSYTFRNSFAKNFTATLDTIQSFGINNIEFSNLFGQTPEKIRAELDARGMFCTSYGVSYDDALNKTQDVGRIAKILGAEFVRVAWVPHTGEFTKELAEKTAKDFNTIGATLKKDFGLTFCYHNHGYEFGGVGNGTLFDLIVQQTDPKKVSYEMDILWVHIADVDPASLLNKYPDRFRLMHVKDLKKGTQHNQQGKTDPANDVTLGTGEIDIPAVIKAARKSKLKYYYIEDESPSATQQVPESIKYLKKLSL
ncbi:MAG TPA: sugar phosphate isomerase/epimerase [Chitinophagaceae bacterium]|nr:sugar phosphate isomerase/epimerase [Chitinophagaceae bacterium]